MIPLTRRGALLAGASVLAFVGWPSSSHAGVLGVIYEGSRKNDSTPAQERPSRSAELRIEQQSHAHISQDFGSHECKGGLLTRCERRATPQILADTKFPKDDAHGRSFHQEALPLHSEIARDKERAVTSKTWWELQHSRLEIIEVTNEGKLAAMHYGIHKAEASAETFLPVLKKMERAAKAISLAAFTAEFAEVFYSDRARGYSKPKSFAHAAIQTGIDFGVDKAVATGIEALKVAEYLSGPAAMGVMIAIGSSEAE